MAGFVRLEFPGEFSVRLSVLLSRHAPHAEEDDSCSINSDPEAKVCKKRVFSGQVIFLR